MNSVARIRSRAVLSVNPVFVLVSLLLCNAPLAAQWPELPVRIEQLLFEDDFSGDLSSWVIEQTEGGTTALQNGTLEIEGGGCTVWYREVLSGPVLIEFDATLVMEGGASDNCRDLNCFFMARHPRAPYDLFGGWRSNSKSRMGSFRQYHELRTYYFGMGGHRNSTTRFRRYTGHGDRPLLEQHDLTDQAHMLEPNRVYHIRIIAGSEQVRVYRDGELFFSLDDPQPYTSGWFGFRTVSSHIRYDNFRVFRVSAGKPDVTALQETSRELGMNKGLQELGSRKGIRSLKVFEAAGGSLSERTVFIDKETNGLIWRMTSDPAIDKNEYTDIPVWSADGRYMLFLTARNGGAERWLMEANGNNPKPLSDFADIPPDAGIWSVRYPDIIYYAEKEIQNGRITLTHIISANVRTGEKETIVSVNGDLGKMMPPHPSEKLFLFGDHMGGAWTDKDHPSRAFIVSRRGEVSEVRFDKLYHRLRFTKSPDGRIFYNFDQPRTSWTCLPDGTDRIEIKVNGGHPDWMEGGEWVIFNVREVLPDGTRNFDLRYDAIRYDGTGLKTLYPYGGHASTCRDGTHIVCDGGPGAGSVNMVSTDSANTSQVLFMNHTSRYDHTNRWHPDHHSTHPHPNSSPDGTKVMSNSDVIGQYSDIYVSVARYPDPPLNIRSQVRGNHIRLSWEKPLRSQEVEGYHVYRSKTSGYGYQRLTEDPVTGNEYIMPVESQGYFVVTAMEYSGLQSRPSPEVYYKGSAAWEGEASIVIEAEAGRCSLPFEVQMDMKSRSNGYLVHSRNREKGGTLRFRVTVPFEGRYHCWALVTGKGSLVVKVNGQEAAPFWGNETLWSWQKSPGSLLLHQGENMLELTGQEGTEKIDKLFITSDPACQPSGLMKLCNDTPSCPANVAPSPLSENSIHLGWDQVKGAAYFNVYASSDSVFPLDQQHLVGSPSATRFIDWGLELNKVKYYRITSVNLLGNESGGSCLVHSYPIQCFPVYLELPVDGADRYQMEKETDPQTGMTAVRATAEDAYLVHEFQIPESGDYAIWGYAMIPPDGKAVFDVVIDDSIQTTWEVYGMYNTWKWSPLGRKTSGSPEQFRLEAGKHTLKLSEKLSKGWSGDMVITNDPSFFPVTEMKSTGY